MTPEQKTEFLEQSRAHYAADMLIKGVFADIEAASFKGCSVGCHLHHILPKRSASQINLIDGKHAIVADHYGYPEWLAHLQDTIFEGLPNGESNRWHVQLAEVIAALPDDHDWTQARQRVLAATLRVARDNAGEDYADKLVAMTEASTMTRVAWFVAVFGRTGARAAYRELRDGILAALPEPAQ